MTAINTRLPKASWSRIRRFTAITTAVSVVLSVFVTNAILVTFSAGTSLAGLAVAVIAPIALGGPLTFVLLLQREQLRQANRQLEQLATTDWLTGCRTRGSFTHEVTTQLSQTTGALLVVDVDNFKAVNDRFGHDRGDQALRLIADTIRGATTSKAIIGRLGGEEFGVFLVGAESTAADSSAESIRSAVAAITFTPDGEKCALSVSIGGAVYSARTEFAALYHHADQRLYQAKSAGRDRVAMMQAA
jgi:diguanylate cyclase